MNHEVYKEMLALEALDQLDGGDRQGLLVHLATCPECPVELEELRDAAAALVYTTEAVKPPAELRARILENIGNASLRAEKTNQSSVVDLSQRKQAIKDREIKRSNLLIWALAASIAIAALASLSAVLWSRNSQFENELARLSRSLETTQAELARERQDRELLAAPETRSTTLSGTPQSPRASAKLSYDKDSGRALFYAYDLPPAPPGKAYQLWFIAKGKPIPGGVFTTDAQGRAVLHDQIPREGRDTTAIFAVTLERAGGVLAPEGEKYLLGTAS